MLTSHAEIPRHAVVGRLICSLIFVCLVFSIFSLSVFIFIIVSLSLYFIFMVINRLYSTMLTLFLVYNL